MPKKDTQPKKSTQLIKRVGTKAQQLQTSSSEHVNKHLTKRIRRVTQVRRFVAGWLVFVLGLSILTFLAGSQIHSASQIPASDEGGTYTEGMVGTINTLNPLFAVGAVDGSATRLIFNGLLQRNVEGGLSPDLAKEWRVEDNRKSYTVTLREGVLWQDGQPFTAQDVIYTIETIQNPETRSSLYASWQSVKVVLVNDYEVRFDLPAPFAPFPNALTVLMLPKHLLADIPADKLRTAAFNTNPVGTGPFIMQALRNGTDQQTLELVRNPDYFRGAPRLDRFVIETYKTEEQLVAALKNREITAAVDLSSQSVELFTDDDSIRQKNLPLNSGVFAFFKTGNSQLADANVRQALALATDRQAVLELFDTRYTPLKTPLLPSQLGYDAKYNQTTDIEKAKALLDQAGWKLENGRRVKDGVPLELQLVTSNSPEYSAIVSELQKQWGVLGVTVKPQFLTAEQLQQTALSAHSYDVLLYGISIGADPDVYAYWHSSQARQGGLNFSEWKSERADSALEVARTRLESVLRTARYQTFLDEWLKSAPAVALYQPRSNYSYHQNAQGFTAFPANSINDRFVNVEKWTVNTKNVRRTP